MIFITTLFKKKFNAELLFTDIGSLTYEIKLVFMKNFLSEKIYLNLAIIQKI